MLDPPSRYCDIVMKGGITSGVVYPLAAHELSKTYKFKNVGGTSAGAIAAAATAAAELGRGRPGAGFERLSELPRWLGTGTNLFSLFQPQESTLRLFTLLTAGAGKGSQLRKAARIIGAATHYSNWVLPALIPSAVLIVATALWSSAPDGFRWAAIASAVLLGLMSASIALAAGVLYDLTNKVTDNKYGLSRGYDPGEPASSPALVNWLEAELDRLADRKGADTPLTFGHLRGYAADGSPLERADWRVNLQMMTTNLTHGRPYTLPFSQAGFYFDPEELGGYFPPRVMKHLVKYATRYAKTKDGRTVLGLPHADHFPVVVATRMSLSFPFLISAVPIYAIDFSRTDRDKDDRVAERCWFSDGGICSNFPLHFFDTLLPKWPTFAINLKEFTRFKPRDPANEANNIYLPSKNGAGITEWWTRFDEDASSGEPAPPHRKLIGFILAILDSARNWRENAQSRVPGYRDRVVTVKLESETEGGLNLAMPDYVIERLTNRGRLAGELLAKRYGGSPPQPGVDISWPNHRWVRYRSAMALMNATLEEMLEGFSTTLPGDVPYSQLVARPPGALPNSYEWSGRQRRADALLETQRLLDVVRKWRSTFNFRPGSPKPRPELRAAPKL